KNKSVRLRAELGQAERAVRLGQFRAPKGWVARGLCGPRRDFHLRLACRRARNPLGVEDTETERRSECRGIDPQARPASTSAARRGGSAIAARGRMALGG